MISNIKSFREIVQSAFSKWNDLSKESIRKNPNSPKGRIIVLAHRQEMFKQGLICIVFCGVYLEALFVILGRNKFGVKKYDEYFNKLMYEAKLELFGCSDINIISRCAQFRKARNDIVHEKAIDIKDIAKCKDVTKEVNNAVELIDLIDAYFARTGDRHPLFCQEPKGRQCLKN